MNKFTNTRGAAALLMGAIALTLVSSVTASAANCSYVFTKTLKKGSTGAEVMNLQKVLNMDAGTMVSASGAGSTGMETMTFGGATMAAVIKFQAAHAVSPTSGLVGPMTRAELNKVCTGTGTTTTGTTGTTTSGPVSVSASVSQPNGTLVAGQSAAKIGEFVFTGNGTINQVQFVRTGVSSNDTLANVYLYDGATRLTDASSVLTDGTIRFSTPWTVSGSRTISVRADIKTGVSGQTVGVAVQNMTIAGQSATVTASGVMSGLQGISNASLPTANFTVASPSPTATSINAGSINQNLWSNSLNVGTRKVNLRGFTLKMVGSAPSNTLSNVGLFVNGTKVSSAGIDGNMRYVFDLSSSPLSLNTGANLIEVRGDVVGGANRNFYMVLEQASDIMVEDSQIVGANLTVTNQNNQLINMQAGLVTVQNGTLTINQDTAFNNTTTVVGGATNVKLGAWKFTSYGEDVKVNNLTFLPTFTGLTPAGTTLVNVGLYVNGGQVSSNATNPVTSGTPITFTNLGSNLLANLGTAVTVDIRGDLVSTTGVNYTAGTVKFDLQAGTSNAQGVQSSQLTGTAPAGGQTLTVSSSNVNVANTAGFGPATKAPNAQQVKIGSFTIQTGSAEGVNVTNVKVDLAGTMVGANQITNLTIKDGSTVVGTPVGNPVATGNNFSSSVTVAQSSTKVLDIYADLGSNSATLTVTPSVTITTRGLTSNITNSPALAAGVTTTANVAVVANTGITFVPASSPVSQFVVGGNSNLAIATFNVKANNVAGAILKDVTFTVPANTVSSVTVNGKTASVVGTTATVYDVGTVIPADASGINIPVSVALVCVNASGGCTGVSNSAVTLTWGATTYNNGSTVATVAAVPAVASVSHTLVASKPTLTAAQSFGTGLSNSTIQVGTFTVAADLAGDVKLEAIPVIVNSAGAGTLSNITLRDSAGNTQIVTTNVIAGGAANNTGTFTFATPRTVTKGTSETYTVYATLAGYTGTAGSQSVTFQLGAQASFLWTDVLGGVTGITGASLNTYPTTSQTKTN